MGRQVSSRPNKSARPGAILLEASLLALCIASTFIATSAARHKCEYFNDKERNNRDCRKPASFYHNVPIMTAVHCLNDGSGNCKVIAGQLEFLMNYPNQTYLGPAGSSADSGKSDVNEKGWHSRIPVAYTTTGSVLYSDQPINWSIWFTKGQPTGFSLLSATSVNWCKYTVSGNWPYKSAIRHRDGSTQIYFFNHQSCFYEPSSKTITQYNTRRMTSSTSRPMARDGNPTIWTMVEQNVTHLMMHLKFSNTRERWALQKGSDYSIEVSETVEGEPILRPEFYKNSTFCVKKTDKSGRGCGLESWETAVYLDKPPNSTRATARLFEIGAGGQPDRADTEQHNFYKPDSLFGFFATTSIPDGADKAEVISLFATYPRYQTNENSPKTYLARYQVQYSGDEWQFKGPDRRLDKANERESLNYVDDIAYLPECKTILVVFGPLYSEYAPDQFDVDVKRPLGSIYSLGANEMIHAFFASGNQLYFYHRLNFVAEHQYTCGGTKEGLVQAKKVGNYYLRDGSSESVPPLMRVGVSDGSTNHREEAFFKDLGLYNGQLEVPDAPDATKFPWEVPTDVPGEGGLEWWVWLLAVFGLLFLLAMLIIGMVTFRRRRRARLARASRLGSLRSSKAGLASSRRSSSFSRLSSKPSSSKLSRSTKMSSSRAPSSALRRNSLVSSRGYAPGARASRTRSSTVASGSRPTGFAPSASRGTFGSNLSKRPSSSRSSSHSSGHLSAGRASSIKAPASKASALSSLSASHS